MKVIINNKPSKEALKNCAKVLEEIVNKELLNRKLNEKSDKEIA